MDTKQLRYTGERMHNKPGSTDYLVSLNRYKFSAKFVKNKKVLDISCGIGHGSEYLAQYAEIVIGVDVDPDTIEYCRKSVKSNNTKFYLIDPKGEINRTLVNKFDVIVSMETIEHVEDARKFLKNLRKYLKNNKGKIILSTPNNYEKLHPSQNPFHTYEFDILELYDVIKKIFKDFQVDLYGQRRTVNKRNEQMKSSTSFISPFVKLLQLIWVLDFKYLGFFRIIEDVGIYKKIGSLQRGGDNNFNIYKINKKSNFINPVTAIYLIHKP